jgi:hypothetical protein
VVGRQRETVRLHDRHKCGQCIQIPHLLLPVNNVFTKSPSFGVFAKV